MRGWEGAEKKLGPWRYGSGARLLLPGEAEAAGECAVDKSMR